MDGLEERVRRALGAGALAADPSLVDVDAVHAGIAARRRRRHALVSTIGVMAVLGAGGGVLLSQQDHKPKSTSVLSDSTPTAQPSATTPTATAQCTRSELTLVSSSSEGAAGHIYTDIVVRNGSTATCSLASSSPGLSFQGNAGSDAVRHDDSVPGGAQRADSVAAGATVHVTLEAQSGCPGATRTYTHLELVLADGSTLAVPGELTSTCALLVSDWYSLT
jgi:hypothetical protein